MIRIGILPWALALVSPLFSAPLSHWEKTHDRVWLGGTVWANPMEDWRVDDGWASCQNGGANRSIHSLTHQITDPKGGFEMSVEMIRPQDKKDDHGGGFRLGVRSELNEHRSNCFARGGINAGVTGNQLILGKKQAKLKEAVGQQPVTLKLSGSPSGGKVTLKLELSTTDGKALGTLSQQVEPDSLLGNIAVVSRYSGDPKRNQKPGYQFRRWTAEGNAFSNKPGHRFGPILWSMYSLSDSRSDEGFVMKMSALTGPMGAKDSHEVELEIQRDGKWTSLGSASLDPDAWTATFRIPKWDESKDTPYRLVYQERHKDGTTTRDEWTGTVKANPKGRPTAHCRADLPERLRIPLRPGGREPGEA